MITKERLEELLKQGATIYEAYPYDDVEEINLGDTEHYDYVVKQHELKIENKEFEYLHETKEDAEFFREFGFIERTERLELPSWEQIKGLTREYYIHFSDKEYRAYLLTLNPQKNFIWLDTGSCNERNYWDCFNKQNYILACRKCKALFLGDDK